MGDEKKTGLWKRKTQKGHDMLTGSIGDERIMIFKNEFKTEEKHPDYIIKFMPKTQPVLEQPQMPMMGSLKQPLANAPEEELPF